MIRQSVAKLALFVAWPFLAALMAVFLCMLFLFVWALIPFGVLQKKEDGNYTMKFPWSDQNHETR